MLILIRTHFAVIP